MTHHTRRESGGSGIREEKPGKRAEVNHIMTPYPVIYASASIRFYTVVIVLLAAAVLPTDGVITSPRPQLLATALLRKLLPSTMPPRPLFTPTETIAPAVTASATPRLPWTNSIEEKRELVYMPMLAKQLEVMAQLGMVEEPLPESFAYRTSTVKPARIGNVCFHNDRFRKVRLTYFDAGDSVQVFNALWYPKFEYDMPMLGIDLISLGKGRVLTVVDFQPLHPTADYHAKHIAPLTAIRNKYPDLQGTLSGKIYDDTSFFSKNMLFGRFTDESKLESVVRPAFNEYLDAYVAAMAVAVPDARPDSMEAVRQRQAAYDAYSALKDPAVGLFDAYFGKEWSADFVHDFLFTMSGASRDAHGADAPAAAGTAAAAAPKAPAHAFKIDATTGKVDAVSRAQ